MPDTETLPARIEQPRPPALPDEMSVDQVVEQVRKIQQVQAKVMKQGEHYGVIPGTQKPTLLKPGAEKLALTFRLDPQYEILESVHKDGFIRYVVRCTLWHIPSGNRIASGLGSCNSHEAKYRYRWQEKAKPSEEEIQRKKADGTGKFKFDGKRSNWHERVENDNPDNDDNTLIKMACKRALVAAVLNGTAASDIFTQDIEDMAEPEAPPTEESKVKPEPPDAQEVPEDRPPPKRSTKTPEPPEDPIWPWKPHGGTPLSNVPTDVLREAVKRRISATWRERIHDDLAVREGRMTPNQLLDRWAPKLEAQKAPTGGKQA